MALATASAVQTIHMVIPGWARRSKESLQTFCRNIDPKTKLDIAAMRWVPWPITRSVSIAELRRLRPRMGRLANLEYKPRHNEGRDDKGVLAWVVRHTQGTFYVSPAKGGKTSQVSGVWEMIWDQIPRIDDVQPAGKNVGPVKMANRLPPTQPAATPRTRV